MQDLTVTGVDNGTLLLASSSGDEFRVAIDDSLRARLRQVVPAAQPGRKVAPREIQAHIRAGMSADDVAAITGASLEYIERFEGPVLAEREYVIESALNVPVHTVVDPDPSVDGSTFGAVIRMRLADLGAVGERWASWKEAGGEWIVKLSFAANDIDHDARWKFDPRRAALSPLNGEANTLSQQGEMPGALIPRLRAVTGDDRVQDSSRFDSGAFDVERMRTQRDGSHRDGSQRDGSQRDGSPRDTMPHGEPIPFGRGAESSPDAAAAAISRAPEPEVGSSQTADLLEALRRRRGEREAAQWSDDDPQAQHPSTGAFRIVDVPLDTFADESPDTDERSSHSTGPSPFAPGKGQRKGRAVMPSWDEIVFGAKSDDDLA